MMTMRDGAQVRRSRALVLSSFLGWSVAPGTGKLLCSLSSVSEVTKCEKSLYPSCLASALSELLRGVPELGM